MRRRKQLGLPPSMRPYGYWHHIIPLDSEKWFKALCGRNDLELTLCTPIRGLRRGEIGVVEGPLLGTNPSGIVFSEYEPDDTVCETANRLLREQATEVLSRNALWYEPHVVVE